MQTTRSTWQLIRLSQQCSSSPFYLIVYRRFTRFIVNQWGSFLWTFFGYRKNISYESILNKAGCTNDELEYYVQVLLSSIANCWNGDQKLTLSGRNLIEAYYTSILQTRKIIKEKAEKYPGIKEIEFKKPLFIIGWPRVGSTFMHNLLCCDPLVKGPPLWQLVAPAPVDNEFLTEEQKKMQIENTSKSMDFYFDLEPELYMLHEMNAQNPDECCHLFEQNWVDRHAPIASDNMNGYWQTLLQLPKEDSVEAYRFYKLTLQLLAYSNQDAPKSHHILKDATHCLFLDSLLEVFPDARFIMLSRKPAAVATSCVAGMSLVARYYFKVKDITSRLVADRVLVWLRVCYERVNDFCDKHKNDKEEIFVNVKFEDFIKDPIPIVKDIYARLGYEYTDEFENKMKQFIDDYNKFRDSKPKITYEPEPFAIPCSQIDEELRARN